MSDDTPQFPQYPVPNPQGIPLAPHPQYHKPLMKLINRMAKKTRGEKAFVKSHKKKRHKLGEFY